MRVSVEKPGSPAEVLAHHGKKGMKWGVRNTSRQNANAIRVARAQSNVKFTKYTNEKMGSKGQRKKAKLVYLKDPDRATALRITRGEKIVLGILGVAAPPVGVGLAVGLTARVAQRKHIERKQARGGYK